MKWTWELPEWPKFVWDSQLECLSDSSCPNWSSELSVAQGFLKAASQSNLKFLTSLPTGGRIINTHDVNQYDVGYRYFEHATGVSARR